MSDDLTPWPAGSLVRGITRTDLPLRKKCEHHLYRVAEPQRSNWGSGWSQMARCLVCGDGDIGPLDPFDFFWKKADAFDIAGCIGDIQGTIAALQTVLEEITALADPTRKPVALRNFD